MQKKALITGITGQDGSYLSELLLEKGYEVHGLIRRAATPNTKNIEHLIKENKIGLHYGDLADSLSLSRVIGKVEPDEVYNLGAQSHVKVSFDSPEYTCDTTGTGTIRLLESIRQVNPKIKYYQASSSEMFGKVQEVPQKETTPFWPRSPYGCAKVMGYWATVNYRESYGMHTSNGILFNHECITANTPVICKVKGKIKVIRAAEVVSITPSDKNRQWEINDTEIWDKNKWSKIKLVTATWNNVENDKQIHTVNCRGGYYEATTDHISFKINNNIVNECKTSELKSNDNLCLGEMPELPETENCSEELAEFLGMMVADGFVNEGNVRFTKNNEILNNRIAQLWMKITQVGKYRFSEYKGGYENSGMVKRVDLSGAPEFSHYLRTILYDSNKFKIIPFIILNATKSVKMAFLKGYNCCDGLKGGKQTTEFKSFTTDSPALALGLWLLVNKTLGLRVTSHPEQRDKVYYHLNINSSLQGNKGKHLVKPLEQIKSINPINYEGWLYDFETESGTFSAGVGLTWMHNSPRRGEQFVTRKITMAAAAIKKGKQKVLELGNLDARRDWGWAKEYVEAMWLMLQQENGDDYVVATNKTYSIRECLDYAFGFVGLNWGDYVEINPEFYRPAEVDLLIGDYTKAKEKLGWEPKTSFQGLIELMVKNDLTLLEK